MMERSSTALLATAATHANAAGDAKTANVQKKRASFNGHLKLPKFYHIVLAARAAHASS